MKLNLSLQIPAVVSIQKRSFTPEKSDASVSLTCHRTLCKLTLCKLIAVTANCRHDCELCSTRIRRFLNKSPDYASPCYSPSRRNSCSDNGLSNNTPQYSWPQPAHSQEDPILLALIMCFPLDSNLKYLLAVCKAILT